jgi:hypothetical protein
MLMFLFLTQGADLEAVAQQAAAAVCLFLTCRADLKMVAHQPAAVVWPARRPNLGLVARTATAVCTAVAAMSSVVVGEANLDAVAQILANTVCPALAHRANLDVVAHTVIAARTAMAAMCLAVTRGSAVEAEMFQQFVAVGGLPLFLDLLRTDER